MSLVETSKELQIFVGTTLADRYTVESLLGHGHFGLVSKCHDKETNKKVAIKVNKGRSDIFQLARKEVAILKRLRRLDPDTCNIVRCDGFFFNKKQLCIQFELLDQSLIDYINDSDNECLPVTEVRPIVHQLATALSHLRSAGIVHADLKPENVMVVNRHETPVKVKIIDFGIALPVTSIQPGMRGGTISYMAPEVILRAPFNEAIDMWALGLIAVELATGYPLYPGRTFYDVLRYIMEAQGQPPDHVIEKGLDAPNFFCKGYTNKECYLFKPPEQIADETGIVPEENRMIHINCLDDLEDEIEDLVGYQNDQHLLVGLIKQMLDLDPDHRIKPLEVLRHPFFCPTVPQTPLHPAEISHDDHMDLSSQAPSLQDNRRQDLQHPNPSLANISEVDHKEANNEPENNTENNSENKTENVGWLTCFINTVTDTFTKLWCSNYT